MNKSIIAIPVVVALLAGCSGMSNTQSKMLSGGAIGAAAGAGLLQAVIRSGVRSAVPLSVLQVVI